MVASDEVFWDIIINLSVLATKLFSEKNHLKKKIFIIFFQVHIGDEHSEKSHVDF